MSELVKLGSTRIHRSLPKKDGLCSAARPIGLNLSKTTTLREVDVDCTIFVFHDTMEKAMIDCLLPLCFRE